MTKILAKNNKGFTLIESLIYLTLFVIVIGGGMLAAYQIIQATDGAYNHVILQGEANFLFRKIDWALNGAVSICSASGSTLTVTKISPASCSTAANLLVFDLDGFNNMQLTKGTASPVILNSSSITVDSLTFTPGGGNPESVKADFTLTTFQNGKEATQSFSTTKYLRK